MMNSDRFFKVSSIGLLGGWLILFSLVPLFLLVIISFLTPGDDAFYQQPLTFTHYITLFHPIYLHIFARSLLLACTVTALCLLLGYPFAYFLATLQHHYKPLLLALMIIPFWTSSLIRTYAIVTLLKAQGPLNAVLLHLGLIDKPLQLLYTQTAVIIGMVYSLLPYMILPLYARIEKLDHQLLDAAYDLGASPLYTLMRITIPLTMPGIIAGSILVFLPAMTLFYIPDILGGARAMLLGNLISNQFMNANNWPFGSVLSIALTALLLLMLVGLRLVQPKEKTRASV